MSNVRVRIAPSPTGYFHIGTARTALFNYLFAKKHDGAFILRIEDTDKERGKKEYEDDIYEELQWLGLTYDEKYVQSEHVGKHKELLKKLVDSDKAYISKEPAKDDATRSVEVVRLRNPGTVIIFNDVVRGDISFDTAELKDFVIARSIDDPLYHFAVVADDGEAGITHVIRGEDHISNTPRQILIQEALGLPRPIYAHLPLILAPDKTKMSKRKHQTSVKDFRAKGFLPEAMINFMALLGWSAGEGDKEIYSMEELIEAFSLENIHKGGAIFNEEKLQWFNKEYLRRIPAGEFENKALEMLKESLTERVSWNETVAHTIIPMLKERITTWDDIRTSAAAGEFDYYFQCPELDAAQLPDRKSDAAAAARHLEKAAQLLQEIPESDFTSAAVHTALWDYATEEGRGAVLWPIRYALSGREKSPDPFELASILGKNEALGRLHLAHDILK
ncbi:glutamate--tRNA ligase [Candidatus Kaiserbacteria bacterium RIFCSPHIGHO2_01_FULL_56_24]|uniref:Glutamate--tRNA ligase n=1 Tax=Candidatus Kaiserbacteria bacterium RIFCSPHIGHO2_01_FULL_56_24 TaxID=1798487 RepID=A0A1F6D8U4_9BACT|nr:MAG: glutamate--tRNA ligase [Candidatus Kaiserbacteria bacterium RIFCSPHIGHO2_01_FULL_56_24]